MNAWVPLYQTALWVALIGAIVWRYHAQLVALIEAVQKRIEKGSSVKAGPFELGEDAIPESVSHQKARLTKEFMRLEPIERASGPPIPKSRYLIAEDLVMRKLQVEFGVPIKRQMSLGAGARFDGLFTKSGLGYGIEVKYISSHQPSADIAEAIQQGAKFSNNFGLGRFMVIMVFVFDTDKILTPEVTRVALHETSRFADKIILRLYLYQDLEAEFGLAGDEG